MAFTAINEGTYGCAGKPILPCVNDRSLNASASKKDVIGKIMKTVKSVEEEMAAARIMQRADPGNLFTLIPLGTCQVQPHAEDFGRKCSEIGPKIMRIADRRRGRDVPQLIIPYGGKDLAHRDLGSLRTVLVGLTPVVKGLVALKAAGAVHSDIKPGNIVFRDGSCRLIDYGLACTNAKKDIFYEGWVAPADLINHTYEYYPPEFDWLTRIRTGGDSRLKSDGMDNVQTEVVRQIITLCKRPQYHSLQALAALDQGMMAIVKPNTRLGADRAYRQVLLDLSKSPLDLWAEVDIYSLGITVGEVIINRMPNHGLSAEEFYKVVEWVAKTTNFNVFTRITPEQAYAEWVAIWGTARPVATARPATARAATARPATCSRADDLIATRSLPAYVAKECPGEVKGGQLSRRRDKFRSTPNKRGAYYWSPIK